MYIYIYVCVCGHRVNSAGYKYVNNEAKQSETQNVNATDLIHEILSIDPSSGENNKQSCLIKLVG